MRRIMFAATAALLVGAFLLPTTALAGGNKVDVCHAEGNGSYHLINVSENAFDQHAAHGDGSPGDAVPGMDGYLFGDDCVPVEANNPPIAEDQTVACAGLVSIQLSASDPDGDDLVNWAIVSADPLASLDSVTGELNTYCSPLSTHLPPPVQWTVDDSGGLTSNVATLTFEHPDADGDGIPDAQDDCFGDNATGNSDGDGYCNSDDPYPNDKTRP